MLFYQLYAHSFIKRYFITKIHFLREGKLLKSNLGGTYKIAFPDGYLCAAFSDGYVCAAFPSVVSYLLTYFQEPFRNLNYLVAPPPFIMPTDANSPKESRDTGGTGEPIRKDCVKLHKPNFCNTPS